MSYSVMNNSHISFPKSYHKILYLNEIIKLKNKIIFLNYEDNKSSLYNFIFPLIYNIKIAKYLLFCFQGIINMYILNSMNFQRIQNKGKINEIKTQCVLKKIFFPINRYKKQYPII